MTEKQEQRIKDKITKIKKDLAADKRKWGGFYDDSRGLRYLPPELYLKLKDYKGALRYFNWFDKNFPEDMGFPNFLFEYTLTLFKNNKIKRAEKKALQTFISNTYIIDYFLGRKLIDIDKNENSNWEKESMIKYFPYSKEDSDFNDFSQWLEEYTETPKFLEIKNEFIDIEKKLKDEPVGPRRTELVKRRYSILENV